MGQVPMTKGAELWTKEQDHEIGLHGEKSSEHAKNEAAGVHG